VALGAAAIGGCIAVAATNPGDAGVPLCWSRSLFGVDCPFCGGLRATNSLLRGDLLAALDHNVVLAVAMPITVLWWVWWTVRQWRGIEEPMPRAPGWLTWTAGGLLVAFGILRNFGGPSWVRYLHSDTFVS